MEASNWDLLGSAASSVPGANKPLRPRTLIIDNET